MFIKYNRNSVSSDYLSVEKENVEVIPKSWRYGILIMHFDEGSSFYL